MANLVWSVAPTTTDQYGLNFLIGSDGFGATSSTNFSTRFVAGPTTYSWDFSGSGFGGFVDGIPSTGTATGLVYRINGVVQYTLTNISMTVSQFNAFAASNDTAGLLRYILRGDDTVTAPAGSVTLDGFDGADSLIGGSGNDWANGGIGNDTINGGLGVDRLFGEAGDDRVFGDDDNDSLVGGDGADSLDGGAGNDTISGDLGDDTIEGGLGADTISGGGGANTLLGGEGDDTITSTSATDSIDGGAGFDTLIYDRAASSANFTLAVSGAVFTSGGASVASAFENYSVRTGSGADTLTLSSGTSGNFDAGGGVDRVFADFSAEANGVTLRYIEQNQSGQLTYGSGFGFFFGFTGVEAFTVAGGSGTDSLDGGAGGDDFTGNGGSDTLNGYAGDDTLRGGDGNDFLFGGTGSDTLIGGAGNDYLNTLGLGTAGVDSIDGGDGEDRIFLDFTQSPGVAITSAGFASSTGGLLPDGTLVRNVENVQLASGSGADTLTLVGLIGASNSFTAGAGVDRLVVDLTGQTESASLGQVSSSVSIGPESSFTSPKVTFSDVEEFWITGTSAGDSFFGRAGADRLSGAGGNDTLGGQGGDDTLIGGAGADWLEGGDGVDVVDYSASGAGVTVSLTGGASSGVGGDAQGDSVFSTENLTGSNFADTLTGASGGNVLSGLDGDDVLEGAAGADTLIGGAGVDLASYAAAAAGVTAQLGGGANAGDAAGDVFTAIEGLRGSAHGDNLFGDGGANRLEGLAGDDVLQGLAGNDTMLGGAGADSYGVDAAGDFVTELANEGFDTVYASIEYTLGANVEALTLLESVGSGFGNSLANSIVGNGAANYLAGAGGDDVLNGGAGDDILVGGTGGDILFGGTGADSYEVDTSSDQIGENANEGFDAVYSTGDYTLGANLEALYLQGAALNGFGNSAANALYGNALANYLRGNEGDDYLEGRVGDDILEGSAGNDILIGGAGSDSYGVDASGDQIGENANEGFDAVYSTGDYTLGANLEALYLLGSALNGFGNSAANALYGNALANYLRGNEGDDYLEGGADNDILEGSSGNDIMVGGTGSDSYGVDSTGDQIGENANEGFDSVYATSSYTLGANLEGLYLTGAGTEGYGNTLANAIFGNGLDNNLNGFAGNDVLNGGAGNDTFVFNPGTGQDVISDFVAGGTEDRINLSAYAGTGITYTVTQSGANTVFSFSNGDAITLQNVTATNLVQVGDYWF